MKRYRVDRVTLVAIAVLPVLAGIGFQARATACAAGNPNTTSVVEATPTSAFVVNGNGTVTHNLTGLTWKQCAEGSSGPPTCAGGSPAAMNWPGALTAAGADSTAGQVDWRLPNNKELASILELCGHTPAINKTMFPATPTGTYGFWSSSPLPAVPTQAWIVHFDDGRFINAGKTSQGFVRLVRGGRPPNAFDARTALDCNVDIDGNGSIEPLADGLLLLRATFGLTGNAVTSGALGMGATRNNWTAIRAFLNERCGASFAP